jgi:hypothetical protein
LGEAVARGLDLDCGCFGKVGAGWFERPMVALVRAVILLVIATALALSPRPGLETSRESPRR